MNRRSFLTGTALGAASIPLTALMARATEHDEPAGWRARVSPDYGPLVPALDETTGLPLLHLPEGFRYVSFGWTGDPMTNGMPTPGVHDGMAAFRGRHGHSALLVRNHEIGAGTPFSSAVYDPTQKGGTTTVEFDTRRGEYIGTTDSLSGTTRNCAGGPTPWGSWLTCEETTVHTGMPHGYVFEVPSDGLGDTRPIADMGRFSHEAVAVDPRTGYVYETEDAGNSSGFYRFVPNHRRRLHEGGRLYMLKVATADLANLGASYPDGASFKVSWVPIETPDNPDASMPGNFVWAQGRALGAATFARLEGCWYGNDHKIYIVSTSGGAGQGQIWEYDPREETITLLFQSPNSAVLNAPDNITVSPRGGLVLCEDGSGAEFVHGLTVRGEIFQFARNNVVLNGERNGIVGSFTGSEFAGACYSPDGDWLFVNVQSPGITLAITGPWRTGAL
jgi:secreted PhoX family phosphatase